jgi:hypothetical protein
MTAPGRGRYTTYVQPGPNPRNTLLWKLFNKKAPNDAGVFYGGQEPTDNVAAANAVVARATANVVNGVGGLFPANGIQSGDHDMFPNGVKLTFADAPDLDDPQTGVKWSRAGDPANPYVPDLSSPGPGRTNGIDKDVNPEISEANIKPNYTSGAPGTGTVSPSETSDDLGKAPIFTSSDPKTLVKGKSSV